MNYDLKVELYHSISARYGINRLSALLRKSKITQLTINNIKSAVIAYSLWHPNSGAQTKNSQGQ